MLWEVKTPPHRRQLREWGGSPLQSAVAMESKLAHFRHGPRAKAGRLRPHSVFLYVPLARDPGRWFSQELDPQTRVPPCFKGHFILLQKLVKVSSRRELLVRLAWELKRLYPEFRTLPLLSHVPWSLQTVPMGP